MGIADKYNVSTVSFDFDIPEEFEFTTLKDLYEKNGKKNPYIIMMYFFNTKGKFGKQTVLATTEELVNAPTHLTGMFEEMQKDDDVITAINNAELGFTIYEYKNDYGINYSLKLIDL